MHYLASVPWSDKQEELIQQTISSTSMKPNDDLSAKLTVADDVKVYKEVLLSLIQKANPAESTLRDFVKATFNEASEQVACVCVSMIRDAWSVATHDIVGRSSRYTTVWNELTTLLLDYGGVEVLLEDFVRVSKKLCNPMMSIVESYGIPEVLTRLLVCAVPSSSNKKLVVLSNSKRAQLVAAWGPMLGRFNNIKVFEAAFRQLFMSLPLQDPAVVAIVKELAANPLFINCYKWWRSKLLRRMKRCDLVHEGEIAEESSAKKRVKLINVDP
ncbi:hypothetical protein L7F22_027787 [Adiantum nelumboides]|nr:hypothetical protein [Adiantum nelumboides]